jgi:hypothetical protein
MDPESNCIILAQLAPTRDQGMWNDLMAPARAQLKCRGIPSTSDEAPGLVAYVAHDLEAHHAPDVCPVPHELVHAVSGPIATQEREAAKAVPEAREQITRRQTDPQSAGDAPARRRSGRSPKEPVRLEHAEHALEAARREHARLAQHREQVKASLRGLGRAYHCVDLARGVRRNGKRIAGAIHAHSDTIRTMAQQEHLSATCLDRLAQAKRVGPTMQATIAFVSGYGRQQVRQLEVAPPASYAMHAKLIPSYDLERVAQTRSVSDGEPLRELAERRRAPLLEPGGALSALSPEALAQLPDEAKRLAPVFQRSSSTVEGRNGSLSLRSHHLRGRDLPRKRECFTAMHNFFLARPDGTTAAERFFGQKPRSLCAAILASVELAPAPLSPPRKA